MFASEYCLLNGQHVYFMPFKMTNGHTLAHSHTIVIQPAEKDTVSCVWARSRKYWFVLDENYAMRPPVTIHRTHKHAIILRLCNLCGSILYIRKHKIASKRDRVSVSWQAQFFFGRPEFSAVWAVCVFGVSDTQRQSQKSFSHCIFICLTLSDRVCVCGSAPFGSKMFHKHLLNMVQLILPSKINVE